jgi:hypothetical protein
VTSHRVLLRKLGDGRFEEVGEVIADTPTEITVTMRDGRTSDLPKAGHVLVAKGGVFHLLHMYPGRLTEIFDSHPIEVVEQVLSESIGRLSGADIKSKLTNLRIPLATIDQAWPILKTHLDSAGTISAAGKPKKYQLKGSPRADGLLRFLPQEERRATAVTEEESGAAATHHTVTSPVEVIGDPAQPSPSEPKPPIDEPSQSAVETDVEVANLSEAGLVTILKELGAPQGLRTLEDVARRLLECASTITEAPADQITRLLALTGPEGEAASALLLAMPSKPKIPRKSRPTITVEQARAAVELAVGELTRADDGVRRNIAPAAVALVDRLLLTEEPVTLPLPLLARVLAVLGTHATGTAKRRERLAALLAARLGELGPGGAEDVLALDQGSLSRAVRDLDLDASSGRALLLSAVYAVSPEGARQPQWWAQVGFDDLKRAAEGPLSKVMQDDEIATAYIAPAVRSALGELSTKRVWASILGAPRELVRHASSDLVRDALARCAASDPVARDWLTALSQQEEVDRAHHETAKAAAAVTDAEERFQTASSKVDQLETERQKLLDQILHMRQEDRQSSDTHDRQIKLDVLRTLATLALFVAESTAASSDAALIQNVEYVTRREGLERIETAGDEIPYEPERHDSLGQHIEPGSPGFVLRPGYTYSSQHEELVLIKAQVSLK